MAERVAEHLADRDVTHVVASPLERAQETAAPDRRGARARDRHRRAAHRGRATSSRARRSASATGRCGDPQHWGTCATRSGRPGASRTAQVAARCWPRSTPRGTRPAATRRCWSATSCRSGSCARFVEGRRLWHDPRKRQCSLASLTSFTYDGDRPSSRRLHRAGRATCCPRQAEQEVRRRGLTRAPRRSCTSPAVARRRAGRSPPGCWRRRRARRRAERGDDQGFVDGRRHRHRASPPADRERARALAGDDPRRRHASTSPTTAGKVVVVNVWGVVVRAVPRRGAGACSASAQEPRDDGVQFVGINTKDDTRRRAGVRARATASTYPQHRSTTTAGCCSTCASSLPPTAIPTTLVLDPTGPGRRAVIGGSPSRRCSRLVGEVAVEPASSRASSADASRERA